MKGEQRQVYVELSNEINTMLCSARNKYRLSQEVKCVSELIPG